MKYLNLKYLLLFIIFQFFVAKSFCLKSNFTYVKHNKCAPTVVEFINNSDKGTGYIYKWNFGLGATTIANDNSNKEQIYTIPGSYIVTLNVSNGIDSASFSDTILISKGPIANFSTSPLQGCKPLTVNFNSTSIAGSSPITSTSWDFRNGIILSGISTSYSYLDTGKYSLLLTVIDANGCSNSIESDSFINVVSKPVADFKADNTFACNPPLNVSFYNLSKGNTNLSYKWDFGNGDTSSLISNSTVYSANGHYNVKLKVTDKLGCTDSIMKFSYINIGHITDSIYIENSNQDKVNKPNLCAGTYKIIFPIYGLSYYSWTVYDNNIITTFTGQDTIVYDVKDSGSLIVKLLYGSSYCIDSTNLLLKKSYIKADFSIDTNSFCALPQKIKFHNLSNNSQYSNWYINNKKISSYNGDTVYVITKKDIPNLSYQQLYSHQYNTISLPFSLVDSNLNSCTSSITKNVNILLPVARFMPDKVSGCIPLSVNFSDSSSSAFNINEYIYKIGIDSIKSVNKQVLLYTFVNPGIYDVSEIIKSGNCYDTSEIVVIKVGKKLIPDFNITPSQVCNGGDIHITGTSNNNSDIGSWKFTSANIFNLNFDSIPDTIFSVYTDTSGYKNINFQINYNGCISDTTKDSVLRIIGPIGNFTDTFTCDSPLVYYFKSNITSAGPQIWNIDTNTYNNINPLRFVFPKSGNYVVKLKASDSLSNCLLTKTKLIKVRQIKADYSINDSISCVGDVSQLNSSTSIDYINTCYNEGFLWNFGDNSPPRRTFQTKYSHVYSKKGAYIITLIVIADNGCADTIKKNIYVYKPEVSFISDVDKGCGPSVNVNFTYTSTDSTIKNWDWYFGDNSYSLNTKTILHNFISNVPITYNVVLTGYDAHNCKSVSNEKINIIIMDPPYFQVDDNTICTGQTVTFTPYDNNLDSLVWYFGENNKSYSIYNYTYNNIGKYGVKLVASESGCRDSVSRPYYISVERADASFTVSDSILNCYPDTLFFVHNNELNGSANVNCVWKFNSNILANNSNSVSYIFGWPGNYKVQLTTNSLNNCKASTSRNITISGPTASFQFSPKNICYDGIVNFQIDSLNDVNSWKMIFGDGDSSSPNLTSLSHQYTSKGEIIPAIYLINNDCKITLSKDTLFISRVTANFLTLNNSLNICYGNDASFINYSTYSNFYNWRIDNSSVSSDFNLNNYTFSEIGNYNVALVATDIYNCSDSIIKTISVVPVPVFSILGDSIMCKGTDSVKLSVNNNSGWKINWSPGTGLSGTNSFVIYASPSSSITYTAKVTDQNGCSTTHDKTILINQPFNLSRSPIGDTSIYIGEKLQLIVTADSSQVNYSWSPRYNISCVNCNNPYVSPTNSVTYKVEVKDKCYDFIEDFNIKVIIDFYLEAPSAFTPNGDSNNDTYKFEEKDIKSFELKIFNRWGEVVFSTNDVNQGWDGKVNGHPQNIDTYTYFVKAETIYGYKFEKKGSFLLLK
jgi:gliding motility-associated-like protein